jgi:hypothetical protein
MLAGGYLDSLDMIHGVWLPEIQYFGRKPCPHPNWYHQAKWLVHAIWQVAGMGLKFHGIEHPSGLCECIYITTTGTKHGRCRRLRSRHVSPRVGVTNATKLYTPTGFSSMYHHQGPVSLQGMPLLSQPLIRRCLDLNTRKNHSQAIPPAECLVIAYNTSNTCSVPKIKMLMVVDY